MFIDNIEELKDVHKYTCGSPNLNKFLEEHGLKSVYSYKLSKDRKNRTMWVYIMSEDLSKLLKQWTDNKPSNKIN